jgi:hypothetical protein
MGVRAAATKQQFLLLFFAPKRIIIPSINAGAIKMLVLFSLLRPPQYRGWEYGKYICSLLLCSFFIWAVHPNV